MKLKRLLYKTLAPILVAGALMLPASAQTYQTPDLGNSFNIGDIFSVMGGGNNRGGGINTQDIIGIASILYQISQQQRNQDQYPQQYPQQYPNQYPAQYPGQYPQQYPTQYPQQYPNQYPQQQYPQQQYPYQY